MKNGRRKRTSRACAHCGQPFEVDPRIGRRHRFCSQPECARASHLHALRKWRSSGKGREYFKGWENADHVREWRKAHPGARRRSAHCARNGVTESLAAALRELGLRPSHRTHIALLVGVVAKLSNLASNLGLQDTIAFELRNLMLLGHGILTNSEITENTRAKRLRSREKEA